MGNVLVLNSQMGNAIASGGSNALLPLVHVWDAEMQMLVLKVSPGRTIGFRLSRGRPPWPTDGKGRKEEACASKLLLGRGQPAPRPNLP